MSDEFGPDKLEKMSDGALRKAIQALENAKGSVEFAIKMMPEDEIEDIATCGGPAKDASNRIDQQLRRLRAEFKRRNNNE